MAIVPHVTAWAGRTKYHADGFLFDWVYKTSANVRSFMDKGGKHVQWQRGGGAAGLRAPSQPKLKKNTIFF